MTAGIAPFSVALAAAQAERALREAAPDLRPGFLEALRPAAELVAGRVVTAASREGLTGPRRLAWDEDRVFVPRAAGGHLVLRARRHAFDRIEPEQPVEVDPVQLLADLTGEAGPVAIELADATVNLAIAIARSARIHNTPAKGVVDSLELAARGGRDADEQCAFLERLATEGHNLHPCARTRLGWDVPDVLAHDLESPGTTLRLVGVRRDLHIGDDVGALLTGESTTDGFALTPVHEWQYQKILRHRYADLFASGALIEVPGVIPVTATAALRTLLLPATVDGGRAYLKVSLDIQVTSTRRSISVASTRNGPVLSALLGRLLADDPEGQRVLLLPEVAGSAAAAAGSFTRGGRDRDLAAILRSGLSGRLEPGEVPVPGGALYARSPVTGRPVVAEIVDRFARTRGIASPADAARRFVDEYARLLLPPLLALATRHGIALEAHLQNSIPTFVDGVPHRLVLRDFAGLRLHPPRLAEPVTLWPGSVVVTSDVDVMRAKLAYTALQANLGEVVVRLAGSHGLSEPAAWAAVRGVVDEVHDRLRADPAVSARARADHAYLTAPTLPHKALLRMRIAADGDLYLPVENPLS